MKKLIMVLVFALLSTSTLLYANSDKNIDQIPSGSPEVQEATKVDRSDVSDVELDNGFIVLNEYQMSFIEDDRGNIYTFESLDHGKEAREVRDAKAKEDEEEARAAKETEALEKAEADAEAKAIEASTKENSADEGSEGKKEASENASGASNNTNTNATESSAASASGAKATSTGNSSGESKNTAEITTVAATPPRSPNVPSYNMNSVGIYHNDQGAVTVVYPSASEKRLKVLVEKGGERSAYNLHDGTKTANAVATYPLQRGDGTYVVRIMENTQGSSYRELHRKEVTLKSQQKHAVFLNSVQEINWSTSDPAVQKAARLTAGMSSEREKVQAVYNYLVRNVKYDHDKVNQLTTFYLPNINTTYSTNKGICYDYASLFAAMLRSQGIPTRMVKGYSDAIGNGEVYHAWNEVYLSGEDRWVIIDTTHDAPYVQRGQSVDMFKGSAGFSVTHRL